MVLKEMNTGEGKHFIIPVNDIEDIEKARVELYRLAEVFKWDINAGIMGAISDITAPMWIISHKKYKEYLGDKSTSQHKVCIHGRGLTDYCEPCGRINGEG